MDGRDLGKAFGGLATLAEDVLKLLGCAAGVIVILAGAAITFAVLWIIK